MARAFFLDAADALMGFLSPEQREAARTMVGSRNLKVWFPPREREHFEVQLIGRGPLRAAGVRRKAPALEIGFHTEHPSMRKNEAVLDTLLKQRRRWARRLSDAEHGPFVGYPSPWLRLSELWHDDVQSEEAAIEAAERLATYITVLEPLLV